MLMSKKELKEIAKLHPDVKKLNNNLMYVTIIWLFSFIGGFVFVPLFVVALLVMPICLFVNVHKYNKTLKEIMKIVDTNNGNVDWVVNTSSNNNRNLNYQSNPIAEATVAYTVGKTVNDKVKQDFAKQQEKQKARMRQVELNHLAHSGKAEYRMNRKSCATCRFYTGGRRLEKDKVVITDTMRDYNSSKCTKKARHTNENDGSHCGFWTPVL